MVKRSRSRSRAPRKRARTRSKSTDPFKSGFRKRTMKRKKLNRPAPKSRKRTASKKKMTWKRIPRDPRPVTTKKRSTAPTSEPMTEAGIIKKYRPKTTDKQLVAKKKSNIKSMYDKAKSRAHSIGQGIKHTAETAAKISQFIEPFLDAAALEFPVLAPAAVANTGFAEVSKLIENTGKQAERGKDAYKLLTDTKKYQKMMSVSEEPINLIKNDPAYAPAPYAHYPPMASSTPSAYFPNMMAID